MTPSTKKTFTSSWSLTCSDHETTHEPSAISRPSRNIPISTVIVAANDVEMFEPMERNASETTSLKRLTSVSYPPRRSSRTTFPSSSAITRLRILSTISRSWVTIRIVVPAVLIRCRSCMIPTDVSGSRFPVGSSQIRSGGWFTTARAIETRCCSPPESSSGRDPALCARPTRASTSGTLRRIDVDDSPWTRSA